MDEAVVRLRERFGGDLPAAVEGLDPAAVEDLGAAMDGARARVRRELRESTDASLQQLPRVLRGLVKRVLGL